MNVRRLLIISPLVFFFFSASAQKQQQSRVLTTDSLQIQAIISLKTSDSSVISKMITDSSGNFSIKNINDGKYILQVEALGYKTYFFSFNATSEKFVIPKTIVLTVNENDLGSVIVTTRKPQVVVKQDTLEYSGSSVKLGEDATTEDIFQKLPGIEVSKNGSIKANGEPVTQIYVDGKPFFGGDIKAVTQNFPADMIDKIQVINKKPDGVVDDGSYEKIINITLKRSKKNGLFGNNTVGYGTSDRHDAKSTINYLHYDTRLSFIGNISNVNGGDANSPGNLKTTGAKISFATSAKKIDISTWAGFEQSKNDVLQQLYRKNIYSDSSTNYSEKSWSYSHGRNLSTGVYMEYKPDSFSVIKINESAGYARSVSDNNNSFETVESKAIALINNGTSSTSGSADASWLSGNINYFRRLSFNGRSFNINLSNRLSKSDGDYYNIYNNNYYKDSSSYLSQNRYTDQENLNNGLVASTSYVEPLSATSSLSGSYAWNYNKSDLPRDVYEFDPVTATYDSILPSISNYFNNANISHTATISYNFKAKKFGFAAGLRYKSANLTSNAFDKDSSYQSNFKGLLPNLNFFTVNKKYSFNIDYNMYIRGPDAMQLQPVIDNNNPLYIRLGNPDLKYTVVQTLRYKYNRYNSRKSTGINASASFSMFSNNISNDLTYDEVTGKQISTPYNTSGAYSWNAWCNFYKPINIGDDKIKWNINLAGSGYSSTNLLNGEPNITTYNTVKVFTAFLYDTKSWIDLRTNFSFTRQTNQYSLQSSLNGATDYITINPVITIRPTQTTEINIDYDHRNLNSDDHSVDNNVNLLNANIRQYVDDKKAIAISLKAFDLLNDNTSTVRTFGDNYVQDLSSNILSRYLLLSVSFRLQHFN